MYFNNLLINPYNLPKEIEDNSFIEYKRYIIDINNKILEKRTTQMLKRLYEGYAMNEKMMCIYLLGINDDGSIYGLDKKNRNKSIKNLKKMINNCNAFIDSYYVRKIKGQYIIQVNIRSNINPQEFIYYILGF